MLIQLSLISGIRVPTAGLWVGFQRIMLDSDYFNERSILIFRSQNASQRDEHNDSMLKVRAG